MQCSPPEYIDLYSLLEKRLKKITNSSNHRLLSGGKIGLEREALRVAEDGSLAQTSHPRALGSPLTHPWITTDFSEALIEFVTPPYTEISDARHGPTHRCRYVMKF